MSRDCIEEVAKNFEGYKLSYGKKKKKVTYKREVKGLSHSK